MKKIDILVTVLYAIIAVCLAMAFVLLPFISCGTKASAPTIDVVKIDTTTMDDAVDDIYISEPEITEPPTTEPELYSLTMEEIELIALVTMAEAEGEPELGQRLVIDTILNRVDDSRFPNTVKGVVYQPHQFEAMWNGRVDRCEVRDYFVQLVIEELESRANHHVIFFRLDHYSKYGTPMFSIGNHYFSEY